MKERGRPKGNQLSSWSVLGVNDKGGKKKELWGKGGGGVVWGGGGFGGGGGGGGLGGVFWGVGGGWWGGGGFGSVLGVGVGWGWVGGVGVVPQMGFSNRKDLPGVGFELHLYRNRRKDLNQRPRVLAAFIKSVTRKAADVGAVIVSVPKANGEGRKKGPLRCRRRGKCEKLMLTETKKTGRQGKGTGMPRLNIRD